MTFVHDTVGKYGVSFLLGASMDIKADNLPGVYSFWFFAESVKILSQRG